jgi:hypothetical protein
MGILTGLETSAAIPQKDKGPVGTLRVLLFGIIAGVNNQGVIHHRARAFRNGLQCFHDLDQHLTVILPDLGPYEIVRLVKVSQSVARVGDAQPFPGTEILAATGGDGEDIGQIRLQRGDTGLQQGVVPVGFEFGFGIAVIPPRGQLSVRPFGIHVKGSKPWFWRKKMTRFGPPAVLIAGASAARARSGNKSVPSSAPTPAATPWSISLRLIIYSGLLLETRVTGKFLPVSLL